MSTSRPPPRSCLLPYTTLFRSRGAASDAWRTYLEIDPASEWSNEARAHLRALENNRSRFDPKMLETKPAETLARTFPQETRTRVSRSEEHTSELQSPCNLVCRLLIEKKTNNSE